MNKPVSLGLLISDLIKTVMYEFWCDYGLWIQTDSLFI